MVSYYEKIKVPMKGKKQKRASGEVNSSASDWLKVLLETFCAKYADAFDKIQVRSYKKLEKAVGTTTTRQFSTLYFFALKIYVNWCFQT